MFIKVYSRKIGRTEKTLRTWIQDYEKNGLFSLLEVNSGGNTTKKLSEKVISFISFLKKKTHNFFYHLQNN